MRNEPRPPAVRLGQGEYERCWPEPYDLDAWERAFARRMRRATRAEMECDLDRSGGALLWLGGALMAAGIVLFLIF